MAFVRRRSEIQRASRFFHGPARHAVGVDHRGTDIRVAEKRLDRAKVVISLQEVRGKRMSEGVGCNTFRELRLSDCFVKRFLNVRVMEMIPSPLFRLRNEG